MKMVASTRTAKERNDWIMDDSGSRFNDGSSAGDDKEEGVENGSEAFLLGWLLGSRWNRGACWNTGNTALRNTGSVPRSPRAASVLRGFFILVANVWCLSDATSPSFQYN